MREADKQKYCSWQLDFESGLALKKTGESELKAPITSRGGLVFCEGFWPFPFNRAKHIISGICLWDGRWMARFGEKGKSGGGKKCIASPVERRRIFQSLEKGRKISSIQTPIGLGSYHRKMLDWLAKKARVLQAEKIFFQIPKREYYNYISRLEEATGKNLIRLYGELDRFCLDIELYIESVLPGQVRIEYVDPRQVGATNESESFLFPYLHPEKFGIDFGGAAGVEDLAELMLGYTVWKQSGLLIPVCWAALDIPAPYFKKGEEGKDCFWLDI